MSGESPVALVTGGGRGIGAATVRRLVAESFKVCVNFRSDAASAERVVRESGDDTCIAVQADVSREADVVRLFDTVDREFGRLDALVNNAGIIAPQCRLADFDSARIERIFATNVTGAMLCSREAVRRMSTQTGGAGGAIVNVSSVAARTGSPGEYIDYAASKGALDTLTTGLAVEVGGEGIRVNAVRPGFIDTGMHADGGEPGRVARLAPSLPMRRGGVADEAAAAICWLLSEDASYVTGAFIDVAGGR
ncbi:MAG: SDR family oxidoreductase [Woeseiaceae bacterium]|nr:SDR family oxidoreductase [Woeseiaceae bacterium]